MAISQVLPIFSVLETGSSPAWNSPCRLGCLAVETQGSPTSPFLVLGYRSMSPYLAFNIWLLEIKLRFSFLHQLV